MHLTVYLDSISFAELDKADFRPVSKERLGLGIAKLATAPKKGSKPANSGWTQASKNINCQVHTPEKNRCDTLDFTAWSERKHQFPESPNLLDFISELEGRDLRADPAG